MQDKRIIELLRHLRDRRLTDAEWGELESLAAGDAFLADALDGLRMAPPDELRERLNTIAEQVSAEEKARRRQPVWYLAAAATALLIFAAAAWLVFDDVQNGQIAMDGGLDQQPAVEAADAPIPPRAAIPADTQNLYVSNDIDPAPPTSDPRTTPGSQTTSEHESSVLQEARPAIAHEDESASTREEILNEDLQIRNSEESPARDATAPRPSHPVEGISATERSLHRDMDTRSPEALSVTTPRAIRGAVFDYSGEPLLGANVILGGTEHVTTTDFDGKFSLDLPQNGEKHSDSTQLIVSYTGYQSLDTTIAPSDDIVITLPDAGVALNEVVVSGYEKSARRKDQNSEQLSDQSTVSRAFARPVDGEKSYRKYIRRNKRYPQAAEDAGIHGSVTLEFTLDEEGTPDEFTVLESLGYGCDAEAIRLIRQGPKWNVTSAQVPVARYTVEF